MTTRSWSHSVPQAVSNFSNSTNRNKDPSHLRKKFQWQRPQRPLSLFFYIEAVRCVRAHCATTNSPRSLHRRYSRSRGRLLSRAVSLTCSVYSARTDEEKIAHEIKQRRRKKTAQYVHARCSIIHIVYAIRAGEKGEPRRAWHHFGNALSQAARQRSWGRNLSTCHWLLHDSLFSLSLAVQADKKCANI